jgi:thiamine biosynthesis lipoprotein
MTAERPAWEWKAMGTTWRLYHDGSMPQAVADEASRLVADDEERWSRFRETSELSRLNRCAGIPTQASEETVALLAEADRWTKATNGVFAPLVGDAVRAWGYRESLLEVQPGTPASPDAHPAARDELVFDRGRRIVLVPEGSLLDLGGIAKTWCATRVARLVTELCDTPEILVDAGGDMVAARGDHVVQVADPAGPHLPPILRVHVAEGRGIATSGWSKRHWTNGDGVEAHHIIDPATGQPAGRSQATVVSDEPVRAEVMAKVLILRPELADTLPDAAIVFTPVGERTSPSWKGIVEQ